MLPKDNKDKVYNSDDEVALLFKRTFATQDGQDVLSVLKRKYQQQPAVVGAAADGAALALLSFIRIGERNVVDDIDALPCTKGPANYLPNWEEIEKPKSALFDVFNYSV